MTHSMRFYFLPERDRMPNFVGTLESGPGNTASRQLGL